MNSFHMKQFDYLRIVFFATFLFQCLDLFSQGVERYEMQRFESNGKVYNRLKVNAPMCELPAGHKSAHENYQQALSLRSAYPGELINSVSPTSTFEVVYDNNFPEAAKTAFQFALDIWARTIVSSVPIKVEANYVALGVGSLANARSLFIYPDPNNAPFTNTFYSSALSNALAGEDIDTNSGDIEVNMASRDDWYYGTDPNGLPQDEFDFVSTALHELAHGLGFSGTGSSDDTEGSWGVGNDKEPMVYDRFVKNGSDVELTSFTGNDNPSAALDVYLTSGNLFLTGPNVLAAYGGPAPIYAPDPFNSGSSFSHWSDDFDNTDDAFMTYSSFNGEITRTIGPVTQALFRDMGWQLNTLSTPTQDASNIVFSNEDETTLDVSWTVGNGNGRLVIARQGQAPEAGDVPSDNSGYTADADITGNGDAIGASKVVYNGTGNSFQITGLTNNTDYHISIFEYNTLNDDTLYKADSPPTAFGTTRTPFAAPTMSASNILFPNEELTSIDLTWTNGDGSHRIVVAREETAPTGTPVDDTDYDANNDFSIAPDLGNGKVVYDGTGNSFTMTGLIPGTTYHFALYEYNTENDLFAYKTTDPAIGDHATDPDVTPPTLMTLNPADGLTDILVTTDLTISFNEPVQKGTGNITVFDNTNAQLQIVDVNSTDVVVNDATVTIDLPQYLPSSTDIYVNIEAGAIEDASTSANDFAGITDDQTWNFTTSAFDCTGFIADNLTINVDSEETNCDTPNGSLSATVDVGGGPVTAGYTFTWYNSNDLNTPIGTDAQINGLAAGDYTVMVEDNATGCEASKEQTIIENKVLPLLDEPDISPNTVCLGTENGRISITADGGQTAGYTFEWSIGDVAKATPDFEGGGVIPDLREGNYTIIAVNNATGCRSESATFTVGLDQTLPVLDDAISTPDGGCGNNSSGQLSITADNGQTNGYKFSWWIGDAVDGQADFTGPVYSGLAAGQYTVSVQVDATGCVATESRTFTVETAEQDIPEITAVVMNGEGCTLPGSGSAAITISSTNAPSSYTVEVLQGQTQVDQANVTNGTTGVTFDGLADGDYTIFVTDDDKGCTAEESVTLAYSAIDLIVPQNVRVTDITDETATLNWNELAADASFEILYETANSDVLSATGATTDNSFPLTSLTDTTTYEASVRAVCTQDGAEVRSEYSAVQTFTTPLLCGADKTPAPTWYKDGDGDGFGLSTDVLIVCDQPNGYVDIDGDCNDADADVYPNAPKLPDGKDNDCDGIVDKADQTIDFALISNKLFSDGIITLEAEASSGLNITFTAEGPVTIDGSEATITGTGQVVFKASQAGNDFYNAAQDVFRFITISKGDQVITFSEFEDVKFEEQTIPYTVTVDSDLPLSVEVSGPADNTADGLKITGVGTVTITATQAGNDQFNAATYSQSFEVLKGDQEIMIEDPGVVFRPGDTYEVQASSSVELPITLEIEGPASLDGTTVLFESAGLVKVIASQEGNENYNAPNPVQLFIEVEPAPVILEPIDLPETIGEGGEIDLPTTTEGGAPLVYEVTGPAMIDENGNLVITGPGLVTIVTSLGDNPLEQGEPIVDSFCVFPPQPMIASEVDEARSVMVFTSSSTQGNQWFRDNATAEGETNQTYEIPLGVNAEIQVQVTIDGCESELSEVVNGAGQQITGIADLINSGQLKAYPNPVQDLFSIELGGDVFDRSPRARIFTLDGQVIQDRIMENVGFNWEARFNVSQLKQGIYLYQLVEGQTVLTGKFIKR